MQHKVTDPKQVQIILNNILRLRVAKGIMSKTMAYEIGLSPGEYSKLEGGNKHNWEKWWDKIADVLGMDKYLLMMLESEKPDIILSPEVAIQSEDLIQLLKALDEKDKAKEVIIELLKAELAYWKAKYYREKERLIKLEIDMETTKKISSTDKIKSKRPLSPAIVGGG
jgi:transcriptional regulator with XRE-family HTH domain